LFFSIPAFPEKMTFNPDVEIQFSDGPMDLRTDHKHDCLLVSQFARFPARDGIHKLASEIELLS
jgi:hypothetical protein